VIERLPSWSDRRATQSLVVWWVGSIVALVPLTTYYLIPVDIQFSVPGLAWGAYLTAVWLAPGFVLGGWKALAVALGRSSIRTGTDKALVAVFSLWAIGWPCVVVLTLIHQGL
jgi:hypothetical protein